MQVDEDNRRGLLNNEWEMEVDEPENFMIGDQQLNNGRKREKKDTKMQILAVIIMGSLAAILFTIGAFDSNLNVSIRKNTLLASLLVFIAAGIVISAIISFNQKQELRTALSQLMERKAKYSSSLNLNGSSVSFWTLTKAVEEALNQYKPGFQGEYEFGDEEIGKYSWKSVLFTHPETPISVWVNEFEILSASSKTREFWVNIEVPYERESEFWFDIERIQMAISENIRKLCSNVCKK